MHNCSMRTKAPGFGPAPPDRSKEAANWAATSHSSDQSIAPLGNVGHRGSIISTGPPVLPTTTRSFTATATGVSAVTLAAAHFIQFVHRQFVDFNVQVGHVALQFFGGGPFPPAVLTGIGGEVGCRRDDCHKAN